MSTTPESSRERKATTPEPRCRWCRWFAIYLPPLSPDERDWRKIANLEADCRRRAPIVAGDSAGGVTRWPFVKPDHWCGEFEYYRHD
jgi:hypothetical protein